MGSLFLMPMAQLDSYEFARLNFHKRSQEMQKSSPRWRTQILERCGCKRM